MNRNVVGSIYWRPSEHCSFRPNLLTRMAAIKMLPTKFQFIWLHGFIEDSNVKEVNIRILQNCLSPMSSSTEWSWFFMEFVLFPLFTLHLDYCNIQRLYDQTVNSTTWCLWWRLGCLAAYLLCYLIRKCRKGASEHENIVNMAYIWQLFNISYY
jgi:hypothetical protein